MKRATHNRNPGQAARAAARDDVIRGLCGCAAKPMDRMGPGSAQLRCLAGMTEWGVAEGERS